MRRHLVIFLKFTRDTGHRHPHLPVAFGHYRNLLQAMDLPGGKSARRIDSLGPETGSSETEFQQLLEDLLPRP